MLFLARLYTAVNVYVKVDYRLSATFSNVWINFHVVFVKTSHH